MLLVATAALNLVREGIEDVDGLTRSQQAPQAAELIPKAEIL